MKHVVILRQPFFDMVANGEKTIESRFSMDRRVPYRKIVEGDELYIKETGKPVTLKAVAKKVEFFELTPEIVELIRVEHGKEIGTDKFEDWQETKRKRICTLVWLSDVKKVTPPLEVPRSNGAGWFLFDDSKEKDFWE